MDIGTRGRKKEEKEKKTPLMYWLVHTSLHVYMQVFNRPGDVNTIQPSHAMDFLTIFSGI